MKIYNRIIIDMSTGDILEEDSFEYNGSVAECKGGSGGSVDYAYNSRLASIYEAQQAIAEKYFQFWEDEYKGLESAQIAANLDLLPTQTALEKAKLEGELQNVGLATQLEGDTLQSAIGLLPQQTRLEQERMNQELGLMDLSTEAARSTLETSMSNNALTQKTNAFKTNEMNQAAPVVSEYYKQALKGVDVNSKVNQARADVASQFEGADTAAARTAGRYGVGGDRFMDSIKSTNMDRAKATAGAMTSARSAAEDTNFARLSNATQTFKGGIGV